MTSKNDKSLMTSFWCEILMLIGAKLVWIISVKYTILNIQSKFLLAIRIRIILQP